ncbi:MAG: hypothetical protein AB1483_10795 [Candidatus Zixiibacteriota bacterium]
MNRLVVTYASIAVALCCLWFFSIYAPGIKERETLSLQIVDAEKRLADFQQTIADLPLYIAKHKSLLELRNDLNSRLYTKKDVLKLFDKLKEEASVRNLVVTDITPPVEELLYLNTIIPDSGQPQFLNIGLIIEGDYINFGKFVQTVEQADYFRGINSCKMYGHADDKSKITLHFGFKALLGSFKDEV